MWLSNACSKMFARYAIKGLMDVGTQFFVFYYRVDLVEACFAVSSILTFCLCGFLSTLHLSSVQLVFYLLLISSMVSFFSCPFRCPFFHILDSRCRYVITWSVYTDIVVVLRLRFLLVFVFVISWSSWIPIARWVLSFRWRWYPFMLLNSFFSLPSVYISGRSFNIRFVLFSFSVILWFSLLSLRFQGWL